MEDFLRENHTLLIALAYGFGAALPGILNSIREKESFASRGYRYGKATRRFILRICGKHSAR